MTDHWLDQIAWNEAGLVPVIVQEAGSRQVLMHAWMNRQVLEKTCEENLAIYWSRSRQSIWRKGETSGHFQKVKSIHLDCDGDTILLIVTQEGGIACHTGRPHCFFRTLKDGVWQITEADPNPPHTYE